jgi:WD40 repeat protein
MISGMFGSYVLVGDTVGNMMMADTLSHDRPQLKSGRYPDAVLLVESNALNTQAIVVFESGRVVQVDTTDPHALKEYPLVRRDVIYATFSLAAQLERFLMTDSSGTVEIWETTNTAPNKIASFNHGHTSIGLSSFSLDGNRVISMGDDGTFRLWDIEKRALLWSYP